MGLSLPYMRRLQTGDLALVAAPIVLFGAHLLGGASDPVLAAVATAAMAVLALVTVLEALNTAGKNLAKATEAAKAAKEAAHE